MQSILQNQEIVTTFHHDFIHLAELLTTMHINARYTPPVFIVADFSDVSAQLDQWHCRNDTACIGSQDSLFS